MSQINLLRDLIHAKPLNSWISVGNISTYNRSILMNSSGIVNQTVGMVENHGFTIATQPNASEIRAAGLLMSPPIVDSTPYMLRIHSLAAAGTIYAFLGRAPAAPTGTNDQIDDVSYFPLCHTDSPVGKFTEVILIPGDMPTWQDKPIAFGIAITNVGTNNRFSYSISAQNLSKTAPQFAASMS